MAMLIFKTTMIREAFLRVSKKLNGFKTLYRVLLLVAIALVQACDSSGSDQDSSNTVTYAITYGYYKGNEKIENHQSETGLRLIFPAVPGAIYGPTSDDILYESEVVDSKKFDLVLSKNVNDIAARVTVPTLTVSPSNAKIFRLGTFHSLPSYDDELGGGGFIDAESGLSMLLAYFSEPVDLRGITISSTSQYVHQISIGEAGWHWLQAIPLTAASYQVSEFGGNTDNIEFKVLVPSE